MARYLVVRLGSLVVSIIAATLIIFLIMHAIPGGPFDAEKSQLSADQQANVARFYGLDKPLPVWLFLRGSRRDDRRSAGPHLGDQRLRRRHGRTAWRRAGASSGNCCRAAAQ
jgi:hypothetical protein